MAKSIFTLQLMDALTGKLLQTTGGKFIVAGASSPLKKSLQNPDSSFASLTNPITPTNGRLRFALDGVSPVETSVDIFGFTGDGRFVVARGVTPGDSEILVVTGFGRNLAVIPTHITDYPAATETDTGLDFATGSIVDPNPWVNVTAIDATETIDVGLLSSESGGDADGFIVGASVATAGRVMSKLATTATLGALLKETVADSGAATVAQRIGYAVGSTAKSITVTTSTGSDTFEGYVCIPFFPPAPA